jgi:hypothetical protein
VPALFYAIHLKLRNIKNAQTSLLRDTAFKPYAVLRNHRKILRWQFIYLNSLIYTIFTCLISIIF